MKRVAVPILLYCVYIVRCACEKAYSMVPMVRRKPSVANVTRWCILSIRKGAKKCFIFPLPSNENVENKLRYGESNPRREKNGRLYLRNGSTSVQEKNVFSVGGILNDRKETLFSVEKSLLGSCHWDIIQRNILQMKRKKKKKFSKLQAKMPVITVNKKLYPKEYSTDYEDVLRKFDVTYINYKTRLRSKKEINIREIDDLYGNIYDRDILKKQFFFFLYHDDINTCYQILTKNRNVLTREESYKILNSLPYIFVNHLKYVYPNEQNVDYILSKLLKTYIFQYANDRNIDFLNFKYKYNELDVYCQNLEHTFVQERKKEKTINGEIWVSDCIYDDGRNNDYEGRYAHMSYDYEIIESTKKYKDLVDRFRKYPANIRLEKVQLLYTKILSMKGNKIVEAFRKHESIKKNKERKIYRNARLRLDPNKLTPYMNEPVKCNKKKKEEINALFQMYVQNKDLIKAALIIRKYTNLIDTKEEKSRETLKEFLRLHNYIYTCNKYDDKMLAHLRMVYYSTIQKPRIVRKICEVGMIEQGENATHKEVYEKELNTYLKKRNEMLDQRMKDKNIDMNQIRDFSSAYPMEWLPVLYKDLFEQTEKERKEKEKEKEKYTDLNKGTINRKRESIKKLFSPSERKNAHTTEMGDSLKDQDARKDLKHDLLNVKNELKIGRNAVNYKKKVKGRNKRKEGKMEKTGKAGKAEKSGEQAE
ncbi:conserved Plasmodium protein, unknown function [Plasmodium ovale]|uniref:Uncharacterized protein n=1 Tax=Plasmodium ovale TaxID=36330 RepID=A0A1C3KGN6_PLAOA|nr:conserved Plasmodium protein, unknown function [Plasmodium ovale]